MSNSTIALAVTGVFGGRVGRGPAASETSSPKGR